MARPIGRLMTRLDMYKDCQHDGLENSRWWRSRGQSAFQRAGWGVGRVLGNLTPLLALVSHAPRVYDDKRYYFVIAERAVAASLKIDDQLKARIQHLADARQRSSHWIMREAIQQYVDHEEARESFKQEALASWVAFRETGRHLTAPEAQTWLDSWGSPGEAGMPECHE